MRGLRSLVNFSQFALLGGLFFLTGCPTAQTDQSRVATILVDGAGSTRERCQTPANAEDAAARVIELVNDIRRENGLEPLAVNLILTSVAEDYACQLIEDDFFAHVHPANGDGPAERAIDGGYLFLSVGENLAGGQTSPEQVVQEWMDSQGHREQILSAQWREIGVAVRVGGEYKVYWVQEFGNPP